MVDETTACAEGVVGNEPSEDGLLKRIEILEAYFASQDRAVVHRPDSLSAAERQDEIALLKAQASGLERRLSHARRKLAAMGPRRSRVDERHSERRFLGSWLAR